MFAEHLLCISLLGPHIVADGTVTAALLGAGVVTLSSQVRKQAPGEVTWPIPAEWGPQMQTQVRGPRSRSALPRTSEIVTRLKRAGTEQKLEQ